MSQTLVPLIHKAPVQGLAIHVGRSGLVLGDELTALNLEGGTIGLMAVVRAPLLGLLPRRRMRLIGHFGPQATRLMHPWMGQAMRLRVVGLTPEFLAGPQGPEVHVSVWVHP